MRMDRATMLNLPKTLEEYKTLYDTTNTKLNSTAKRIAQFLRNQGYDALPIAASCRYDRKELIGDLSHKHVAVAAGLGKFGINNLVLTPEHGPCVRFATVLTSAPLRIDKPLDTNQCLGSKCMKCVKICPAGALENPKFDPEEGWQIGKKKCYQYMHETLGGELCGLCIKVCPVGSKESNNH
jgi:epoxyqueuosine reductase QueG